MKTFSLAVLMLGVSAVSALAAVRAPCPSPAPELAAGVPAVLAVIGAYMASGFMRRR